ncbi:MAG: hypothetical protein HQL77_06870 [Magnetococcales bacterium]|nr:hypothetical protein [Magnetococcales bacterium]
MYHIINGNDATVVVPGKASLAFSLAVACCKHFNINPILSKNALEEPLKVPPSREPLEIPIALSRHFQLAKEINH